MKISPTGLHVQKSYPFKDHTEHQGEAMDTIILMKKKCLCRFRHSSLIFDDLISCSCISKEKSCGLYQYATMHDYSVGYNISYRHARKENSE